MPRLLGVSQSRTLAPRETMYAQSGSDDLWDIIVEESNRYVQQKLGDRFANFHRITCVELKAFIGINIITGIMRLPNYALFWSTDDFFW